MKKFFVIFLTFCALIPGEEKPAGAALLDKVIDLMNPPNSKGKFVQIIETSSGDKRTFEYESFSAGKGEKSIIRYLSPSRVKGNAILMTDYSDNIWMYFRRTNRVRKLASHARKQKFEGSDFTYEDMGSGKAWKQDYEPVNKGRKEKSGEECYLLELKARNKDASYSRIDAYVRTGDYFPLQLDYYDESGQFLKSLYLEDIRNIEGVPTAMKMTMKNHIDGTQTVMKITEITYKVNFRDDFFSERNLKR